MQSHAICTGHASPTTPASAATPSTRACHETPRMAATPIPGVTSTSESLDLALPYSSCKVYVGSCLTTTQGDAAQKARPAAVKRAYLQTVIYRIALLRWHEPMLQRHMHSRPVSVVWHMLAAGNCAVPCAQTARPAATACAKTGSRNFEKPKYNT